MASRVGRSAKPALALQAFALRQLVPDGKTRLRPSRLVWTGRVQPTPETSTYLLRIDMELRRTPSVRVLSPSLKANDRGLLPHVYDDGTLCVSQAGDWRRGMLLTESFLPWACEWLIHYELWLATELWYGDGPDRLDAESQARILHPYN